MTINQTAQQLKTIVGPNTTIGIAKDHLIIFTHKKGIKNLPKSLNGYKIKTTYTGKIKPLITAQTNA